MLLRKNHHFLVSHLGEKRCVFVEAETFQPRRNIYNEKKKITEWKGVGARGQEALDFGNTKCLWVKEVWRRPTFHAAAVLLERVASRALVLSLLAARGCNAALRRQRCVIRRGKVLPPHCIVWARPVGAAGLGARGDGGHGLLQPTGLYLSPQTWQDDGIIHINKTMTGAENILHCINQSCLIKMNGWSCLSKGNK